MLTVVFLKPVSKFLKYKHPGEFINSYHNAESLQISRIAFF